MRKSLLCVLFLLLPISANAQSGQNAMRAFGLFGTWAAACQEAPSPANGHSTYAVTSAGGIELRNSFGEDYEIRVYNIVDARRVGPDKLSMRQVLAGNEDVVLDVIMLKENDRIRIWSSLTIDGKTLVKDGNIAAPVNRETRWVERCKQEAETKPG
jgi:hypothetical protein